MKMFTKSRKKLSILLAFVLVLSLSTTTVFAQWPSFQKDSNNNAVITGVAPPISSQVTVKDKKLDDSTGFTHSGVNTTPVMQTVKYNGGTTDTTIAYVLYGADDASGITGGARLAAYDVATGNDLWNIQLAKTENYATQLSTPVITAEDTMYAAVTNNISIVDYKDYDGADTSGSVDISNGVATFNGNGTVSTPVGSEVKFNQPIHTLYVTTNLKLAAAGQTANYKIRLIDKADPTNIYTLFDKTAVFSSYGGTYDTYNGTPIPAGEYKITLEVNPSAGATVTASNFQMIRYESELYEIKDIDTDHPKANIAKTNATPAVDMRGEGQVNTPLYVSGDYLYAGMYGGTRSYYQYNINTGELKTFAANDDFYNGGAVVVDDYVYFGGDEGNIYKLSVSGFTKVDQRALGDGRIRSAVVSDGTDLYLTTQGVAAGKLWRINPDDLTNIDSPLALRGNSTSTPVISQNGYVYVGWNGYTGPSFTSIGGVQVADINDFASGLDDIYGDGTTAGDPVQASPIVFSDTTPDEEIDYIYFTTNSANGGGYGYYNGIGGQEIDELWSEEGTSGNNYALQGFAADNGYLVYGDNGSYLYIIK